MSVGRPPGQTREALRHAARQMTQQHGCATLRAIAAAACVPCPDGDDWSGPGDRVGVSMSLAKSVFRDMVRAGELVQCGRTKAAGSAHWIGMYEFIEPQAWGALAADAASLDLVCAAWARPAATARRRS